MLNIYSSLFKIVEKYNIPYCSWKNNHLLEKELSGNGDIDLLVHPHYRHLFEYILSSSNFIRVKSSISEYPFIQHYYGYDEAKNKFAHLHVYYKLITGDSHLKNYRFPFESEVIGSSEANYLGIKEASAEHQMQLYFLRKVIKKTSFLGIFLYFRESEDYKNEYEYIKSKLSKNTNNLKYLTLLNINFPFQGNKVPILMQVQLRLFMLSWHRGVGIKERIRQIQKRIINKIIYKRKKSINGSLVAIVGLDGSGKSTAVEMIEEWLNRDFNVKTFHFGRPPPTLITLPVRLALIARKALGRAKPVASLGNTAEDLNLSIVGKVRYAALAYERNILIKKAHRYSLSGGISILDRFPSSCIGLMDSPRITPNEKDNALPSMLYKIESTLYQSMPPADLLFKFNVNVENALIRNKNRVKEGKETDDEIRQRFKLNKGLKYNTLLLKEINANNEMEQVHQQLCEQIWKQIVATN